MFVEMHILLEMCRSSRNSNNVDKTTTYINLTVCQALYFKAFIFILLISELPYFLDYKMHSPPTKSGRKWGCVL